MRFQLFDKLKFRRKEVGDPKRTREEFDFQPGYLEVVERPPAPLARITAIALTSLIVIVLIWAVIGQLDIHANATGRLLIHSRSKVIQSLEAGEIAAIHVHDGQSVNKGDVLINLNPVGVEAEVQELQEQLNFKMLELARFRALLTDDPIHQFIAPEDAPTEEVAMTRAHLASVWKEVVSTLESLNGELAVNQANQQARQTDIKVLNRLASNIEARLKARRLLAKSKLLSRVELLEQERELLELERSRSQQQTELAVLNAEYQSLKDRKDSYLAKISREYYDQVNQAQESIAVLSQRLIKVEEKQRLQSLRSPVDGVVQQLAVHTLGGVVQPAQQLMVIVPDDAMLEADVMVLNKDVGFVHAGQSVEIKVDSFPYTRYGTIAGKVMNVSRDAVKDEQQGLVFPARIQLAQTYVAVDEHLVPLQAGMSVMAEIRTGKRRVIDYLLSPLQQYQSEALRER
ncbi:Putative ABC associated RTX toxin transporter, HlyD/MFP family [Photobacterium marinum]|uniref:Membrane fusion protein (MFP) family protein n=1 Tax=Photobacterium marinum TaxID=1056511 RepID=L8JHF1_9GAMM|nr:HlyD family type I secretion periplasmic adaptor subunit [Photobacterium marinum]ELR66872.1 Putative ABC associated RTX toxin transporter, HlyD/MFP family [Photobacterium marinum]